MINNFIKLVNFISDFINIILYIYNTSFENLVI